MKQNDTIVAIATASGVGSITIVRVSGSNSLSIAKKLSKKTLFFRDLRLYLKSIQEIII